MNEEKKKRAKGGFSSETLSLLVPKKPQMSLCNKKKRCDEVPATVVYKQRKTFSLLWCLHTTETRLVKKEKKDDDVHY